MCENGKYFITSLVPNNIKVYYPVITINHNPNMTTADNIPRYEPERSTPYQVIPTLMPGLHVQHSAYPFMMEDSSFIGLTASKQISESAPHFQNLRTLSDRTFEDICSDSSVTVSPLSMQFIPKSSWTSENMAFGLLVSTFFRRRNSTISKFPYKLYNALRITEFQPQFFPHVGVKWITDSIIWVDREAFARLLGVKTIEGGLFHQQGNFPSHGFEELSFEESEAVAAQLGLGRINLSVMRLIRHSKGLFQRNSIEKDLEKCKWKGNGI